ncbi:Quinolinate synthase [Pseudomonas syringae pv. actinidiae]|uniref:Quinolinate synthase n=1 Tax=Pseudomonas syringae pv. actinidiae TaxID=103796 RepID=A0AAN4Q5P1_PSESF|nr:Quinolinate synthase [Pseudomonas syringae pv. actinidiae]
MTASFRARSKQVAAKALIFGFRLSMRSIQASSNSTGYSCLLPISDRNSVADLPRSSDGFCMECSSLDCTNRTAYRARRLRLDTYSALLRSQ